MHARLLRSVPMIPALLLACALAPVAQAASVTGQLTATLILTNSCLVNGTTGTSGLNFGVLDFGQTDSQFTQVTGQVLSGSGALSVQCSNGATPTVTVRAGAHDNRASGGTRALFDNASHYVAYDLYTDVARTQLLAIGSSITLPTSTGAAQTVNLYGKAVGGANLPAGTYTDTVAVELSF